MLDWTKLGDERVLKTILTAATAGFVMAAVVCAGVASAAAAPLSLHGGLPNLEQVEISPDGKLLAVAVTAVNGAL